jgi:murein DD-endopeptidase
VAYVLGVMVNLALDPPPSRRSAPRRSSFRPIALGVAFVVTLGVGFWLGRTSVRKGWLEPKEAETASMAPRQAAPAASPTATPTASSTATPTATPTATATPSSTATPTAAVTPIPSATPPSAPGGPQRLVVTVNGPLEDAIGKALGTGDRRLTSELTAVVNRLLVWDMRIAKDGRKGDRLEVLWTPPHAAAPGLPESGEPVVEAVRYASSKLGKVIAAYRYKDEGARWARYFRPDGTELEPRLVDAPVADYEQITSLLKDGRRHKGIDFKTPVGSPVRAPFDGVIERRNWNFAGNGNCLDIHDGASGRHAIFLHLEVLPKEMAIGRKVKKGEVIASSGNSGHSFAPHLHYQLEDGAGKVLDPFEVQRTELRVIPAARKGSFEAERNRLDALLKG